ncbi:CDF family Co(II)/Ni(II) efflux transporter DmeF [Teredinibacter sp. KSP-S5-2]|uniref:CDF family Co(II)/Ni(II) efflux transporter DmeF n=1 Tax=Teredinibacter sp. KSP-S5-2 TaxID=3034506 RepID=UPI002934A6EC|nr:CDF family Co(II)/Ni(II) efflux transporter DmeF [Teredinibacter sp. KSP-S5-2]WNO08382.1 CDF family Co(II)/Ni(II) efflux transporter DmeF [Teredinibacter sp. KSP-S5-2]
MHFHSINKWQHSHNFSLLNKEGEKRTFWVLCLTAVTMVAEIVAGTVYGSMALLADGWHMGTHVAAFLIALFAYRYARNHANDPMYTFGTGKVNMLGGFASAVALSIVALMMLVESIQRLLSPQDIQFDQAIVVAVVGLVINLVSALLLKDSDHHDHDHGDNHHHDHNLKAAYIHVLADALTSVLAIAALIVGKMLGWLWFDAVMGIVGGLIIIRWSVTLVKQTSPVLLDASIEKEYEANIIKTIESDEDNKISDIHVWKVGADDYAAIIAVVTHHPHTADHYKMLLRNFAKLSHITVEVNVCSEP